MNKLINIFPEINHELMIPLQSLDDEQICHKWLQEPDKYRYLLAIFYRYYQLQNSFDIDLNVQYLIDKYYVQLWYFIFDELFTNISLSVPNALKDTIQLLIESFFLKEEIANEKLTADNQINQENIRYLPLQYFLAKALNNLSPLERIILITKDKFGWEEDKILQYLQQQNQPMSLSELKSYYTQAHFRLVNNLPTDIITICL